MEKLMMIGKNVSMDYDGREIKQYDPKTYASGDHYDYTKFADGLGILIYHNGENLIEDDNGEEWYSVEDTQLDDDGEFNCSIVVGYSKA